MAAAVAVLAVVGTLLVAAGGDDDDPVDVAGSPSTTAPAQDVMAVPGASEDFVGLEPGRYLFATIHRAENRTPDAIAAWGALLTAVARPDRPVVLALHPGTRVVLETSGVSLPAEVRIIEPQGYRTTLTLQLHAAAVLTDSGGVQREAAWLGVPCLVLRGTTEWVEAVAESGGRMVVVGLDAARAVAELERLAPPDRSASLAVERVAFLRVEPATAAAAIVAALEDGR